MLLYFFLYLLYRPNRSDMQAVVMPVTDCIDVAKSAEHAHEFRLEDQAKSKMQEVGDVNKKRKLKHEAAGRELDTIEEEWKMLITKNRDIEIGCAALDQQIADLEEKLKR